MGVRLNNFGIIRPAHDGVLVEKSDLPSGNWNKRSIDIYDKKKPDDVVLSLDIFFRNGDFYHYLWINAISYTVFKSGILYGYRYILDVDESPVIDAPPLGVDFSVPVFCQELGGGVVYSNTIHLDVDNQDARVGYDILINSIIYMDVPFLFPTKFNVKSY